MSTATTSLALATQKSFGTLTHDFYKNDANEFYVEFSSLFLVTLPYKHHAQHPVYTLTKRSAAKPCLFFVRYCD